MAEERSVQLHAKWVDASMKFDYFVLGVALALVGYLGEALTLGPLGFGSGTVELVAVVSLLASAVCGFKRIETFVTAMRLNVRYLWLGEDAEALRSLAARGGLGVGLQTGETISTPELTQRASDVAARRPAVDKAVDESRRAADRWYRWRNRFLLLGFVLLIAARVVAAYGP